MTAAGAGAIAGIGSIIGVGFFMRETVGGGFLGMEPKMRLLEQNGKLGAIVHRDKLGKLPDLSEGYALMPVGQYRTRHPLAGGNTVCAHRKKLSFGFGIKPGLTSIQKF
jgi:hypothetical protein